jgi:hypothetical protein
LYPISAATPVALSEDLGGFPLPLGANAGIVPRLGHSRLVPKLFPPPPVKKYRHQSESVAPPCFRRLKPNSILLILFDALFKMYTPLVNVSADSAVGIVTGYGLDDRGVGVRVPVGSRISLHHVVQTGSGVHPTYQMGTGGFFPGGKAARARR